MVYVILTTKAFAELMGSLKKPVPLWLNAGVATPSEVARLRSDGWDVSIWTNRFDHTDVNQLENALATVVEHHPEHTLWVER